MTELIKTISSFELKVLDFVSNYFSNPVFDAFMPIISATCNHGEIWIVLALTMLFFKKTRKAGFAVIISLIIGYLVGNMTLKPLIARVRPFELSAIELIINPPTDFSFPSGHTLASFESAFAINFYNKKFGKYAFILASVIAFSRLYLYVHYPTDIVFGIILGFLIAVISKKITEKLIVF